MAKGIKDLLALFNNQVNSNELSAIMSASDLKEVEIQDEDFEKIEDQVKGLMTVDKAVTNKEVKSQLYDLHKKRFFTDVEEMLNPLADDLEVSDKIKELTTAKEKIDVLKEALQSKSTTSGSEEVETLKKSLEKYKTTARELETQIKTINEEAENKIKESENNFNQKLLKKTFYTELNNRFKLAEAYDKPSLKNKIFEDIFENASKKAHLKLDGDSIGVFDPELPEKPLFLEGNKPAGIEDLVSSDIHDYLKKSTPPSKEPSPGKEPNKPSFEPGSFGESMSRRRSEYMNGAGVPTS